MKSPIFLIHLTDPNIELQDRFIQEMGFPKNNIFVCVFHITMQVKLIKC